MLNLRKFKMSSRTRNFLTHKLPIRKKLKMTLKQRTLTKRF
jgi:hypothetical protein